MVALTTLVNTLVYALGASLLASALVYFFLDKKNKRKLAEVNKVLAETNSTLRKRNEEFAEQKTKIEQQRDDATAQRDQIQSQNKELEMHRSHLEQLIKERTREHLEAKERAEESDRLKSAFLENMSHEIRTPMNAILGFINLLDNPALDKSTRDYYHTYISQSGKTLLRLIDDIIDFSRLEAGQIYVDERSCSINELVNDVITVFRKKISIEKPEIIVFLDLPESDVLASTDPNRVMQILNHLLENAMKFTEKGQIKLVFEKKDDWLIFKVEDTGEGIEEKYIERIFDRFFKIGQENARAFKGAGLGLSICKNLAALLGGFISAQSTVNAGSVFTVKIPFIKPEAERKTFEKKRPVNYIWDDKTVLIAEDEDTNYHFLEAVLTKTGAKLIRAENGVELLEEFEKNSEVDIILLDIKMPGLDGFNALKLIRQTSSNVPILAQTAYNSPSDRKKCLELGCDDFLAKPIPQHLLLEKMNKLLGN